MAKNFDSGKEQDKLLNRLERQEKKQAFHRGRFLRFKLPEIHNKLSQALLVENVIETDQPTAVSDGLLRGLKRAMKSTEFDFKYFVAPLRDLVARPNPYALFMTQYIMEVLIDDPGVIEIYGTDEEIYTLINKILSKISLRFEQQEKEITAQLQKDRSLIPGSRDYEIQLDQLMRKKMGDPQQ